MGEAKLKQYNRKSFLLEHRNCVYCGSLAVTTDHCPPRCFFIERKWPETYEFPCCKACNEEARLDEQALSVVIRSSKSASSSGVGFEEWTRLLRGVRNNQPAILQEWGNTTATSQKRFFRKVFGRTGDKLRYDGWGAVDLGPLTCAAIDRFMIKLAKAIYYRHTNKIFDGIIYAQHLNLMTMHSPDEFTQTLIKIAPLFAYSKRGKDSLVDQFIYRFNISEERDALYAVVMFSDQFVFQLTLLSVDMAQKLEEKHREEGKSPRLEGKFVCRLRGDVR